MNKLANSKMSGRIFCNSKRCNVYGSPSACDYYGCTSQTFSQHRPHICNVFCIFHTRQFLYFMPLLLLILFTIRMTIKEFCKTTLHWPIIILQPAMLWKNKVRDRRITTLFQCIDLRGGCIYFWIISLPVPLDFQWSITGYPDNF